MNEMTVAIVGAGYGGVRAALALDRLLPPEVSIIVIDRGDRHEMYSLLYETATAVVSFHTREEYEALINTIGIPYERIFSGTRIKMMRGIVDRIALDNKIVHYRNGDGIPNAISFDYIVMALGSETNFFGIPGLKERTYSLKSVHEALNMRNALEELFAKRGPDDRINIAIGGAGFSGIELAGELVGFLRILALRHEIPEDRVTLSVVEAGGDILPGSHHAVRARARKRLSALGVHLYTKSPIASYDGFTVYVAGGIAMPADLLIWTAGIRASHVVENIPGVTLEKKCLVINEYLQIVGYPFAFGLGDAVYCVDPSNDRPIPATAQRALDHGNIVAHNIAALMRGADLRPYMPKQPAFLAPVGGKFAIAHIGPLCFAGYFAWVLKMLVTLKYLAAIVPMQEAVRIWLGGIWTYVRNDT